MTNILAVTSRSGRVQHQLNVFSFTILFFFFLITSGFHSLHAQPAYTAVKAQLYKKLKSREIGPMYKQSIDQFYNRTCDSLIRHVKKINEIPVENMLIRLFQACDQAITKRTITRPRITSVNYYFLETIRAMQQHKPLSLVYKEVGLTQSKILGYAFNGSPVGDTIQNYADLREMILYPYFIPNRIGQPRFSVFRDTLLYILANRAPEIFNRKLVSADTSFGAMVGRSANRTVKAIAATPGDIYFNQAIPFGYAVLENRASQEEVRQWILNPPVYYSKFTEEILRLRLSEDPLKKNYLRTPLTAINAKMAKDYFINEINALHEKPAKQRFAIIEKLSARELYFLILGGEDELYTSSFMHLFDLFIERISDREVAQFFEETGYYQFDRFLSILSVYGVEQKLIEKLNEPVFAQVMSKYFVNLSNPQLTDNDLIIDAVYLAEIMHEVREFPEANRLLCVTLDSLQKMYRHDNLLYRLYGGYKDVLKGTDQVIRHETEHAYDKLQVSRMKQDGHIVEACFFYDDEDGAASYATYNSIFEPALWKKEDKGNYLIYSSRSDNKMTVYINKPNTKASSDTAQKEMMDAIEKAGQTITLFVHRGHSYHLPNSLEKMNPEVQFLFLGSCGGYQNVLNVFKLNPEAQFIATRKIGSKLINDPLLKRVHTDLLKGNNIDWRLYWKDFDKSFKTNHTKDLFSGYTPPYKFYGILFIRGILNL